MTLQEKLNAYKSDFVKKVPPEALKIMQGATEDLKKSDIAAGGIKAGDRAPDFSLKNQNGQQVALEGLLKKGPVVLAFYRGRW